MDATTHKTSRLLRTALLLSVFTIVYNLIEGLVSLYFGEAGETLALMGFGVDSFVEVISGSGIAHMVWRMKRNPVSERDAFEKRALRVTGIAFYLLVAGLLTGAILSVIYNSQPESTSAGVIISLISIATMYYLYRKKLSVGTALQSDPIISDARCTKSCFYLSFILLASSLLYELFGVPYIDAAGSLGIAYYAYREGKEAMEKAASREISCHDDC